jgi:hypothetical protein
VAAVRPPGRSEAALRLPVKNLADRTGGFKEVAMPLCPLNRHKAAQYEIRHNPITKRKLTKLFTTSIKDTVHVSTLVDTILKHVGKMG